MTNKQIQNLIDITKKIHKRDLKKGYKLENNHKRCNLVLSGGQKDDKKFDVFIRQNQMFIENFSVGLNYKISDPPQILPVIRYNGVHSTNTTNKSHHSKPHIHRITSDEIQSGSKKPPLKNINLTKKYSTFEQGA